MVLFVECVFSKGFYIALGEVFYDNRGFFLVQYSVEATFEQILIVEIELIAHGFAEIVVVHFISGSAALRRSASSRIS